MKKTINILLIILLILSLVPGSINIALALTDGSDNALEQGQSIWSSNNCICSETYTAIRPKQEGGKIVRNEINFTLNSSSPSNGYCIYNSTSTSDVARVPCNSIPGDKLMSRYIEQGLIEARDAEKFVSDASMYAAYVQDGLATRTQEGSTFRNLGTGNFDKAMFNFNQNAHFVYSFLIGFAFITSLLVFILIFIKITWLPEHPMQRRAAMEDIVTSGVATILLGGIWIIISLFQSIFDNFWSTYAVYSKDWKTVGNMFLYEYKSLIVGILGVATLIALLMMVKNFIALMSTGETPNERKQKTISILLTGIATAGLGGLTVFTSFFWNMLN